MRQNICFDLDGTLTDPAKGITNSIRYACDQLGLEPPTQAALHLAIGPPIQHTFAALLNTNDEAVVMTAVRLYRERYTTQGMLYENAVYPRLEEALQQLVDAGKRLFVATSKPTIYADRILQHFGLDRFFVNVYGSELDGTRAHKADLLAYILDLERLASANVAMVGDRKHDMIGARHNGMVAVGVTYGYGSSEELIAAGAEFLCDTPDELATLLRSN